METRMKKLLLLLAGTAMLSLLSCTKTMAPADGPVQVKISVAGMSPDTKAIKTAWTDGDKINIWFGDATWSVLPQLVLTYSGGSWNASDVDASLLSASGTFKALYEGSNAMFGEAIDSEYAFFPEGPVFKASGMEYDARPCTPYMSCAKDEVAYTFDSVSRELTATIDEWTFLTTLQVVVSGLTGSPENYVLSCTELHCAYALYYYDHFDMSNAGYGGGPTSSGAGWCGGVENADGVAFNFEYARNGAVAADYQLFLYDIASKKMYEFSKENVIVGRSDDKCSGVKIPFASFQEWK